MKCACGGKLLQKSGTTTRVRITGAVEFVDGVCKSQCFWCKGPVTLPLQLRADGPVDEEQFVLREPKRP